MNKLLAIVLSTGMLCSLSACANSIEVSDNSVAELQTESVTELSTENHIEQVSALNGVWYDEGSNSYIAFVSELNGMYMAMNSDLVVNMFDIHGGTNVDIEKVSGDSEHEVHLGVRKEDGDKCLTFVDNMGFNFVLMEGYYKPVQITSDKIITIGGGEDDYILYKIEDNIATFGEGEDSFTLKHNDSYDYLIEYILKYFDENLIS